MDKFWVVTLFHFQPAPAEWQVVESLALSEHEAMGIEEFSLNEAEVDEILGTRSYSGGDLPQEVLDEVESKVLSTPINYRFFFSSRKNGENFLSEVRKIVLSETQLEEHDSQDWNAEWKKHYAPIKVSSELEIIPSWQKDFTPSARNHIFIYPGQGFGTGSHETTFLCLKLFTECLLNKPIKTVLDFGSGSGILGLATFKFFPEAKVDFYDIDPEANKNCYQNAEINDLTEKSFRLLLPEVRSKLHPDYDLVFANILESILLVERDALVAYTKPKGALILSGLLLPQVPGIIKSYSEKGMKLVAHEEKGDWAALLFERNS